MSVDLKTLSATELAKVKRATESEVSKHAAAYAKVLATSSEKNIGIKELRAAVAALMKD